MAQVGHLTQLHEKYYDKGLRVIAISKESTSLLQSKVVDEKGGKYWIASDPSGEYWAHFADGRVGIPHTYVVDATGKIVGEGVPNEGRIEELLANAFDPALGRDVHGMLKSAAKFYEKGQVGKAWSAAERYLEHDDREVKADALFVRERAEAYAAWMRKVTEGAIADKDYVQAMEDLKDMPKMFEGMEAAAWAAETFKTLDADPAVDNELKAWKDFEKAREKELRAEGNERKLKPAITAYERLAKKYPGTRAAGLAEAAAKRLGG